MRQQLQVFALCLFVSSLSTAQEEIKKLSQLSIGHSYEVFNHDLESDSFKSSSSSQELGSGFQFAFESVVFNKNARASIGSYLSKTETPFGISPEKSKATLNLIRFDFEFTPGFYLGVEHRERKATQTTPNQMHPRQSKTSLRPAYRKQWSPDQQLGFGLEVGLLLPIYQYENGKQTGSRLWTLAPDLKLEATYLLNPNVQVSLGLNVLYESNYYSGTGTRGTNKATETLINTQFPFEIRFLF